MEPIEANMENIVTEDISSYSVAPSEADIDFSDFSESDVLTALSIFEGPEADVATANSIKSMFTAMSNLDQYSFYSQKDSTACVEVEDIQDYSVYSAAPSEAGVELMDAPERDVLTALSIYDGPELDVKTAELIDSCATANTIADDYSIYSEEAETRNVEIEEASSVLSTAADDCFSLYEAPPSEADCDITRIGLIEKNCIGVMVDEDDITNSTALLTASEASVSLYESPPTEADCDIPIIGENGKTCIGFAYDALWCLSIIADYFLSGTLRKIKQKIRLVALTCIPIEVSQQIFSVT